VKLRAAVQNKLPAPSRYIRLGRIRKRVKRMEGSAEKFVETTGKAPVVGDPAPVIHRGFVSRVAAVEDDRVVLETLPPAGGNTVDTPFGEAIVHDVGDYHHIELDVYEGKLVRTGDNMGYVHKVDDRFFYIDYGHPYGGMELSCDIVVSECQN
jgi:hypothetical protein